MLLGKPQNMYSRENVQKQVKKLLLKVKDDLHLKNRPYKAPWKQALMKGLYTSKIQLSGMPQSIRQTVDFDDANNFVTGWIQKILMDLMDVYDDAKMDSLLSYSVPAVWSFRDKNKDPEIPALVFWQQKYDRALGGYSVKPYNVYRALGDVQKMSDFMANLMEKSRISRLETAADMLREMPDDAFFMSRVPPDVDCTMMGIDIGGKILEREGKLPRSKAEFFRNKIGWRKLADLMVDISYTPFKATPKGNDIIDPRTYIWLHPFLVEEKKAG